MNIQTGDKVQWTSQQVRGNTIIYRACEGRIIRITGDIGYIKRRGKVREYAVPLAFLRPVDVVSELDELFGLGKTREGGEE